MVFGSAILTSCSSSGPKNTYRENEEASRPILDEKYSLKKDREVLETLREQVPPEKKNENDELALILNLMADKKKSPEAIRQQFDQALRKKRELFDKDVRKERDAFTQKERKSREEFLAQMKESRDQKFQSKPSSRERSEFIKDQDNKRAEYFAAERDRRQDFESDIRERRKTFEDYIRERQNTFNQELRSYQKEYSDKKWRDSSDRKLMKDQEAQEARDLDAEISEAKTKKSYFLQSGESQ